MEHITKLLDLVTDKLTQVASSDVVVGDAIELGPVTIVPMSRVSIGFGVGGGEGEGEFQGDMGGKLKHKHQPGSGKGTGGGTGGGGQVRPVAVAIFSPDGVEVVPIADRKGILDKIFDKVPSLIEMVEKAQAKHKKGSADDKKKAIKVALEH